MSMMAAYGRREESELFQPEPMDGKSAVSLGRAVVNITLFRAGTRNGNPMDSPYARAANGAEEVRLDIPHWCDIW